MRQLVQALVVASCVAESGMPAGAEPWRHVHAWLGVERDRMAEDLERAHAALLRRARAAGDAAAIEKLHDEPPRPRQHGYGVLPEIVASPPRRAIRPDRTRYALETLSTAYAADLRDAALLAARSGDDAGLPLAPWVEEFRRLRDRMRNLEDHLDYHARWQVAVVEYRSWFGERNRLADRARELVELIERGGPAERVAAVRRELMPRLAPFRPVAGLAVERETAGGVVLPVEIGTDIEDDAFLARAREAIEEEFSRGEASRAAGFAVRVSWRRIPPRTLYPQGAPARASEIDLAAHVRRFPADAFVLTTGAASTHAVTGRAVLLGPGPIAGRTLAHEFAHLLGFDDAYLRSYEGDPAGAWGVVLVEWVGLADDLMGNIEGGAVTPEMIETLLDAYGTAVGRRTGPG
jgi:hypothetical protein